MNVTNEAVLFDKLQGLSSTWRRERDDAYRQNQLAGERCRAVQEEWTALQKTVADLKTKLNALQAGEKLKEQVTKTKQQTHALKEQVDFQHADLVQKRIVVHGLRTGQQATVHKYRDAVTNVEHLIESRRARLAASQESLHKELYVQLALTNSNSNSNSNSTATSLQEELGSRENLDPLEDQDDDDDDDDDDEWQNKHQSKQKWTRLVQTVADNVHHKAFNPTAHQCAVLERVVQGYQQHLGLQAQAENEALQVQALEVDTGGIDSGENQPLELESTNKTIPATATTTVANPVDTTDTTMMTDTLVTGTTTGSTDRDGDDNIHTGKTCTDELDVTHQHQHHDAAANPDYLVTEMVTALLPTTAETETAPTDSEHAHAQQL